MVACCLSYKNPWVIKWLHLSVLLNLIGPRLLCFHNGGDNQVMRQTTANSVVIEEKQTSAGAAALTDVTFHPEYIRWLNTN
jgi:hypothetical protein